MSFNPDSSKQIQEVIFSQKLKKVPDPPLAFNNTNISQWKSQTHFRIILDSKLIFEEHYKTVLNKTNRMIGFLCKRQSLLPRQALIIVYKALFDLILIVVMFDQTSNTPSHEKLESTQYNACFALTGTIRGNAIKN